MSGVPLGVRVEGFTNCFLETSDSRVVVGTVSESGRGMRQAQETHFALEGSAEFEDIRALISGTAFSYQLRAQEIFRRTN
jgi:hypothetical protein